MYEHLAILACFVFLYSIVSGGLARTPVSGAVVYTLFGLAFGPLGLGLLRLDVDGEELRLLAELTLALVLFTDAANADLRVLRRNLRLPLRLLLVGLPLTIALGVGGALLLFDALTLPEAALLATLLAPTDAALGKAVVSDKAVPARIREVLNVESGLNDGICVPVLFVFLALATSAGAEGDPYALALRLLAEEIGIGAAVGVGVTLVGSGLVRLGVDRAWVTETWRQLPAVMLAIACFTLAQVLQGSGFIAAFVGGLVFGWLAGRAKHPLLLAAEGTGDTLALTTWVIFGAVVIPEVGPHLTWSAFFYALLSLTLIRMLPVFAGLGGLNMGAAEKLFVGWFGPRGLASIVFAVIVFNAGLPGGDTIAVVAICTVLMSIVTHGLSANPLIALLAASMARRGAKPAARTRE